LSAQLQLSKGRQRLARPVRAGKQKCLRSIPFARSSRASLSPARSRSFRPRAFRQARLQPCQKGNAFAPFRLRGSLAQAFVTSKHLASAIHRSLRNLAPWLPQPLRDIPSLRGTPNLAWR
jgi:hypothetical protein